MQFFTKFGKIICWRPPGGLASPATGNPGSAPAFVSKMKQQLKQPAARRHVALFKGRHDVLVWRCILCTQTFQEEDNLVSCISTRETIEMI